MDDIAIILKAILTGILGGIQATLHNTVLIWASIIVGLMASRIRLMAVFLLLVTAAFGLIDINIYNSNHPSMPIPYVIYTLSMQFVVSLAFGAPTYLLVRLVKWSLDRLKRGKAAT